MSSLIGMAIAGTALGLWLVSLERVTELPWGLETPAQFIFGIIALLREIPWLDTIWTAFLIYIGWKIVLLLTLLFIRILAFLRGGG